jgi:hypothetical protein
MQITVAICRQMYQMTRAEACAQPRRGRQEPIGRPPSARAHGVALDKAPVRGAQASRLGIVLRVGFRRACQTTSLSSSSFRRAAFATSTTVGSESALHCY